MRMIGLATLLVGALLLALGTFGLADQPRPIADPQSELGKLELDALVAQQVGEPLTTAEVDHRRATIMAGTTADPDRVRLKSRLAMIGGLAALAGLLILLLGRRKAA